MNCYPYDLKTKYIIGILVIFSCSRDQENKNYSDKKTVKSEHKLSFFDSVSAKADFTLSQIRHHINIPDDDSYFTSGSRFSGDTIYYPNSNHPIIILHYSDGHAICSKKLLLVYDRLQSKNTDYKLVETNCDIDYGTDYDKLDYKVFKNRVFYTRDAFYEVGKGAEPKITITDKFYQIDSGGKIKRLRQKPVELVLPEFVPIEVTDPD